MGQLGGGDPIDPVLHTTFLLEQPPVLRAFYYTGQRMAQLISQWLDASRGKLLSNLSGIDLDLNKTAAWPKNWWPLPPYKGRSARDSSEDTICFIGPWNENWQFRAYVLGSSWNIGNPDPTKPGILIREIPVQHFSMPWLYAMEAEIIETPGLWISDYWLSVLQTGAPQNEYNQAAIAFADASTGTDYQACKISVTYRRPRYDVRTDDEVYGNQASQGQGGVNAQPNQLTEMSRFLERQSSLSIDALPLPATTQFGLFYAAGPYKGQQIPQGSARILFNSAELSYTWRSVPDIPYQQLMLSAGRVNSVPFDPPQNWQQPGMNAPIPVGGVFLGYIPDKNGNPDPKQPINGYPAGTVLCPVQGKYERVDSPTGRILWDILTKFLLRIQPINMGAVDQNGNPDPSKPDYSIADQPTGHWAGFNNFPVIDPVSGKVLFVPCSTTKDGTGPPLYPSTDHNQIFTQPTKPTLYQGAGSPNVQAG